MTIERTNFDAIIERDLEDLIQASVPEGLVIEYKRDAYGGSDGDKREVLKDISSFANSAGGHLIIGMDEADGLPKALTGLPGADVDSLINRLESLARDGIEPRITGIRMRRINLTRGGSAIVIRIPRSWNPPHRVSAGKHNRFYVRNSGGVHEVSVEELRVLFNMAADVQDRARAFRSERLARIESNRGAMPLSAGDKLTLHIIPFSAFGSMATVDLEAAHAAHMKFRPLDSMGMTPRFNLDGFVNIRGGTPCLGYTQVFRSGIVEAAWAAVLQDFEGHKVLPATWFTDALQEAVPGYFEGLKEIGVPAPFILMLSLQNMTGAKLGVRGYEPGVRSTPLFPDDSPLPLPEIILDDYVSQSEFPKIMRPIFDALWNAAGFSKCNYYAADGTWKPKR